MSDTLLNLAQNPQFRKLVKSTGLPIPMPTKLARARGPWAERPLMDRVVVVGSARDPLSQEAIAMTLASAGANAYVVGRPDWIQPYLVPWPRVGAMARATRRRGPVFRPMAGRSPYGA